MVSTIDPSMALQMCKADVKDQCAPYTRNWRVITRTTNNPTTRKATEHPSYATSPRKTISEMEDTSMQKVGMREDNEKKPYESYRSRERHYERRYQLLRRRVPGYAQ